MISSYPLFLTDLAEHSNLHFLSDNALYTNKTSFFEKKMDRIPLKSAIKMYESIILLGQTAANLLVCRVNNVILYLFGL